MNYMEVLNSLMSIREDFRALLIAYLFVTIISCFGLYFIFKIVDKMFISKNKDYDNMYIRVHELLKSVAYNPVSEKETAIVNALICVCNTNSNTYRDTIAFKEAEKNFQQWLRLIEGRLHKSLIGIKDEIKDR